jgi:membrane-associated phospholipid phosphatase
MIQTSSTSQGDALARRSAASRKAAGLRWLGGLLVLCAALLLLVLYVDLPLAVYLHDNISPTVYKVFEHIGRIGDGGAYAWVALVVYAMALLGMRRGSSALRNCHERLARGSLLLMAGWIVGGLMILVLKKTIARARPEVFFEHGFYGLGHAFKGGSAFTSFPSSHSLTAFVLAAAIAAMLPSWRYAVYLAAIVVGFSRLVNLDHYASDVLAAGVIAIVVIHFLAPYFTDPRYTWPQRTPLRWFRKAPKSS